MSRVRHVSRDMHARPPGTRAKIRLKNPAFDLIMVALGCESEISKARLLGVDPKTIYRVRRGSPVGDEFIAQLLSVMRERRSYIEPLGIPATFEGVFEIVPAYWQEAA